MAKTQSILACRHGHDGQLKFKLSIRTDKNGDFSDFERGMVVGVRQAGLGIFINRRRMVLKMKTIQ